MTLPKHVYIGGAWPYANGSLHLGHITALIGGDVLARWHRLKGDAVLYTSGSDCHGTPIVLEAEKQGVSPAAIAARYHSEFRSTLLDKLGFSYDAYSATTTENHKQVVQAAFLKLVEQGLLEPRMQSLAWCEKDAKFLPDRYVEGVCPNCGFEDARGDQCDNCGKVLDATDLKKPRCKLCGTAPIWKESEHFFLRLPKLQDAVFEWLGTRQGWRKNATQYIKNIVGEGLRDRAVTRDSAWGVPIPVPGFEGKCIYVWFEAVCGYLSSSQEWAQAQGKPDAWKAFWEGDAPVHYYIHGKDNIPFHAIIWPAILMGLGLHKPDRIFSSEYLTFGQKQFSKSRGHVVKADAIVDAHGQDAVRYYLIMGGPENADSDFTWEDFQVKVNGELAAKLGNLVNRTLSFAKKHWPDGVGFALDDSALDAELKKEAQACFDSVDTLLPQGEFRAALRELIRLSEAGNRFIDVQAPWTAVKTDKALAERLMANLLWLDLCIAKLARPFMPALADAILTQMGLQAGVDEQDFALPKLRGIKPADVAPLIKRVELTPATEEK